MTGRKVKWVDFIAGANVGFKRSVLNELGGFEQGRRECPDTEFVLRARTKGYHIYFCGDAVVMHDPPRTSLGDIFRYSSRHASHTIPLRYKYKELMGTPFVLCSQFLVLLTAPLIALKVTFDIYISNPRLLKVIHTAPVIYALKLAWCWGAASGLRKMKKVNKK